MGDSNVFLFGSFTEEETGRFKKSSTDPKRRTTKESQDSQLDLTGSLQYLSYGCSDNSTVEVGKEPSIQFGTLEIPIVKLANKLVKADLKQTGDFHQHAPSHSNGNQGTNTAESLNISASPVCGDKEVALIKSRAISSQSLDGVKSKGVNSNGSLGRPLVTDHLCYMFPELHEGPVASTELLPHGLINPGNLCFLNATLQALLTCSPFVQFLQESRISNVSKVEFPSLAAFYKLVNEVGLPNGVNLKKRDVLKTGRPFRPTMFDVVLKKFTPDVSTGASVRPRQEDAQEFLSFVMDQMHEELLKLEGDSSHSGAKSSLISAAEDDEWETVGPKNKSAVTRTQTFVPSKLSAVFGGQLHSVVTTSGKKPSATSEPFLLLHLDIYHDTVYTVEDALHLFCAKETLEEYRTSTSGKAGVTARKSVSIQTLPKIMILHLKRFRYTPHGSTKLHKPVRFPVELVLNRDLLFSANTEGRRYELISTITHHGKEASKGHYTADARYPNGQWLRFDDASVTAIGPGKVLHEHAYILFYSQV